MIMIYRYKCLICNRITESKTKQIEIKCTKCQTNLIYIGSYFPGVV